LLKPLNPPLPSVNGPPLAMMSALALNALTLASTTPFPEMVPGMSSLMSIWSAVSLPPSSWIALLLSVTWLATVRDPPVARFSVDPPRIGSSVTSTVAPSAIVRMSDMSSPPAHADPAPRTSAAVTPMIPD
jgi:hypothetical protein